MELARLSVPILAGLVAAACLSGQWDRTRVESPIDEPSLAALTHGDSLDECLGRLGAPTFVFEHRIHGLMLVYVSVDARTVGATASVPLTDSASASVSYNDARESARGLVLRFDEDWRLEHWNQGLLSDIAPPRPRPASVEDIEGAIR